ncbi:hypothetical protein HMPREF0083_03464 [Aneurinibacillus aneurinilyticus ATCC 12856]|uniref:Uncharacterized protein n=1 Tax=Aneurinibacillus aneurinilyticus ATCC 12856 TaxID=649747 RepID=U1Y8E8_ANEAE|nr:hypothetical protein HMPREF0083_03464 [Aneurinibacillus aneurinilyticus ATCC 12856]
MSNIYFCNNGYFILLWKTREKGDTADLKKWLSLSPLDYLPVTK